ncbi:MAG: FAD binding domain-containing protein [Cetobacterium sp.]
MLQFSNYLLAESLDSAYNELVKNKKNIILGGTSYLRMGDTQFNTAIDLSNLSLSYINEARDFLHIGAMTSFRDLEVNPILKSHFSGIISKCVENILGVQFRNNVTVGATVFSKYGFSDLIPVLLALETTVVLQGGGEIELEDFLKEDTIRRDILVKIKIKKSNSIGNFQTIRRTKSDYAVLNLVLTKNSENKFKIAVGARPGKAVLAKKTMDILNSTQAISDALFETLSNEIVFESNMRASEEYRRAICKVMLKRALQEVL